MKIRKVAGIGGSPSPSGPVDRKQTSPKSFGFILISQINLNIRLNKTVRGKRKKLRTRSAMESEGKSWQRETKKSRKEVCRSSDVIPDFLKIIHATIVYWVEKRALSLFNTCVTIYLKGRYWKRRNQLKT